MLHLLKIDLKKLTSYRTFWIICGLYFITLGTATASGMEFLKWLARTFEQLGSSFDINRFPLYHFPDVWLNLIWSAGWLKLVLAVMVVISVTNEFAYRTIRQNIIDGLSRWQFLLSKILTNAVLSLASTVLVFLVALVTGMIYSPEIVWDKMITDTEFVLAYFLEMFFFLSYALMLGILVQRSGLTIVLVLLSQTIEVIIKASIIKSNGENNEFVMGLLDYFPMQSIWNLIPAPFPRYVFQEIQDYVKPLSAAIVLGWTFLFNYFSYLKLKRSDI